MNIKAIGVTTVNEQLGQSMQKHYSRQEVEQELDSVLKDYKFATAPQMSAFLRFVVTQTLDGNAERIKAYTVAVDALGKPDTFDPQSDPSVRVLAKRLRDTLTAYYERTTDHTIFLRLYTGSYIPQFELAERTQADSGSTIRIDSKQVHTEREASKPNTKGVDMTFANNNLSKP